MSSSKSNSKAPLITVLIIFLVLAALTAISVLLFGLKIPGVNLGIKPLNDPKAEYNERVSAANLDREAARENTELIENYNEEVVEIENYNNSLLEEHRPEASSTGWDLVDVSGFGVQNKVEKTVSRRDLLLGGGILVNYWHAVPEDMPTDELKSIQVDLNNTKDKGETKWQVGSEGASIKVYPVVLNALDAMLQAAEDDGITDYIVDQAWRSNEAQQEYWDKEAGKSKYGKLMGEELRSAINKTVSYPGTSEYQSGFAVCLLRYKKGEKDFNATFAGTEHSDWLLKNSWKYGFIFRFPITGYPTDDTIDKSWITGRNSQMSVYRYVGKANAAIMNMNGWCMEEYYQYLKDHPHLELYENGVLKYEVVRYQDDGMNSVTVQFNGACKGNPEVTVDNLGGIIVGMCY